jgi:hypothetical protein
MRASGFSPPLVDNRFGFESPTIYTHLVEPQFDWNRFRRSHLQFQLAESLHDSRVYDRCNCSMVTSSNDSSLCLAHAANQFSQVNTDGSISSCPCMFCRKHFSERDRPQGLPTKDDLKQLFPMRDLVNSNRSSATVMYLSRPFSAPFHPASSSLDHTSARRYIPAPKRASKANDIKEAIRSKSAVPTKFGMRLDAEPNHDHTQIFDHPRERDAVFRSLDDYFHMTSAGRPTMIL